MLPKFKATRYYHLNSRSLKLESRRFLFGPEKILQTQEFQNLKRFSKELFPVNFRVGTNTFSDPNEGSFLCFLL